jgi:hypothetical protein
MKARSTARQRGTRRGIVRAGAAAVLVALAAAAVVTLDGAAADAAEIETPFTDDDWTVHEPNINAIGAAGITLGCNPPDNDHYCPSRSVTRGEMAAFLVRAIGLTDRGDIGFIDDDTSIFEADIEKLANARIVVGCNPPANTRFCPGDLVTRAQMASFLGRALKLTPLTGNRFVDTGGSVHAGYIDAIAAEGITFGCNPPANTRYCPGDPVTRAQTASFLARAFELEPVYNQVALRPASTCNRDRTVCTASLTLPAGAGFDVTEGWQHARPFIGGEETVFRASGTRFDATLNGTVLPTTRRDTDLATVATREWLAEIRSLSPGTHTLRGTWRWDGVTNLVVVLTVVVP